MKKYLRIDPKDNVIVALETFSVGDEVMGIRVIDPIPMGHKMAVLSLEKGDDVIKYGHRIGMATRSIKAGEHVHTDNVATALNTKTTFIYHPFEKAIAPKNETKTIKAYLRASGEVGIRNEIYVLPTVGCVNGTSDLIVQEFKAKNPKLQIDDVRVYHHPYGCSQLGGDFGITRDTIKNLAMNPNAGGVLLVGLGCENNKMSYYKETFKGNERIKFLVLQDVKDEIEEGVKLLDYLYLQCASDKRIDLPLSLVRIGLKCGGSDGLSGITANPLIGRLSDRIVSLGGTTLLTEIPEMFGAEDVILSRSASSSVFDKMNKTIQDFKDYYTENHEPVYENPSPGNKDGGITTLEDKSLGCITKGGTSALNDVLDFTDRLTKSGLNVIKGPGNDLVAVSELASAGCQLVLFSTGRGTPFGGIIPTYKISTNTALFNNKPSWIDFDAGRINESNQEQILDELFDDLIRVIEGKKTRNEINGFKEIAVFKSGVTL